MTYTVREFRDFLEEFATFEIVIPRDNDHIMTDIPMPADNLVCRVNTGVNLHTSRYDGSDPEVLLYNHRTDEVAYREQFSVEEGNWQERYEETIRNVVAQWREYVL